MEALFAERLQAERSTRRQEWQLAHEQERVDAVLQCVRPPNPRCSNSEYAAFVNDYHVVAAVRDRLPPAAVDAATRRRRAQELLGDLIDQEDWTAALGLLYYPHSTVKVRPAVVELDGQLCLQGAQEKVRADRRQDVARLVPVVLDVDRDTLERIVAEADLARCVAAASAHLHHLGFEPERRAVRRAALSLFFDALQTTHVDLLKSPRGWPALVNLAAGHVLRSNQWATYLRR